MGHGEFRRIESRATDAASGGDEFFSYHNQFVPVHGIFQTVAARHADPVGRVGMGQWRHRAAAMAVNTIGPRLEFAERDGVESCPVNKGPAVAADGTPGGGGQANFD